MNVRIEENNLRFKISEDELKTLLSGQCLHSRLEFVDKVFIVAINPQGRGKTVEPKLIADGGEVYLTLLVPSSGVQELSDMGRSRVGLEQVSGNILINIQVDVRADSRKVGKR